MSESRSVNSPTSVATPNYQTFQYLHTLEGGVVQDDMPHSFPFALSPDSQRLITVELNETLKIWDFRTGFLQTLPSTPTDSPSFADKIDISPDGKRCYIVYDSYSYDERDTRIQIQDITTGQVLDRFNSQLTGVDTLIVNSDETLLAIGGDDYGDVIEVWDLQTKRPLYQHKAPSHSIRSVHFSPDGQRLLIGGYQGLKVCESQTGTLLYRKKKGYCDIHLSPSSPTVLGLDESDLIRQWSLKTGKMMRHWPLPKFSYRERAYLFSPDGNVLCSLTHPEEEIKLWDWRSGELFSTMSTNIHREAEPWLEGIIPHEWRKGYVGSGHPIYEMQFTLDGRFMVTSGGDYTIRIWGSPASDPTTQFRYPEPGVGERIGKLRKWAIGDAFAGMFSG